MKSLINDNDYCTRPYIIRSDGTPWYAEWEFHKHRPVFVTGVFNDYLGFGTGESVIRSIVKNDRHFSNDLHRRVYKKSKKKINRLIVVENRWGQGRFHTHMILQTPEHLSGEDYQHLIRKSWLRTRNGVDTEIKSEEVIFDEVGLKNYLFKEVSPYSDTGVDVENSYISRV